ncbi:hypothetical protein Dimus_035406 [Dionaea muscipula]
MKWSSFQPLQSSIKMKPIKPTNAASNSARTIIVVVQFNERSFQYRNQRAGSDSRRKNCSSAHEEAGSSVVAAGVACEAAHHQPNTWPITTAADDGPRSIMQ